jgi:hypothetical protein
MKASRIRYLVLLISFSCLSCSTTKDLTPVADPEDSSVEGFSPLPSSETARLFKAGISTGRRHQSGLFLIKDLPQEGSTRILFLSELGLSLLDMEYRADEFTVISVQDFLDRTSLLKMLQEDFRSLLLDLSLVDRSSMELGLKEDAGGVPVEVLKLRHRSQKYTYFRNPGAHTDRIIRRKGLLCRVEYRMEGQDPLSVHIRHRGTGLQMDLVQLDYKGSHAD